MSRKNILVFIGFLPNVIARFDMIVRYIYMFLIFPAGVMKRVLRAGMGPSISEFVLDMQEKEMEKPEAERRKFEQDDIQMACEYAVR